MNTNNKYNVDQLLRSALASNEKADTALVQRVKNAYVEQNYESKKTRAVRSPLRVAIIIICLFVLTTTVAVATNLFGLKDLLVPAENIFTEDNIPEMYVDEETTVPLKNILSLQGYIGSPEYEAFLEWTAFTASYDSDHKILDEVGNDPTGFGQMYEIYGCYTQEMVDKLNEIANKYNLILHGEFTGYDPTVDESAFDSFMNRVAGGNFVDGEYSGFSGYVYEDGTFQFDYMLPFDESTIPPYEWDIEIRLFWPEGRDSLNPERIDELWGEELASSKDVIVWVPTDRNTGEFIVEDAFTMDYSSGEYVVVPYDGEYDLNKEWKEWEEWQFMTNEIIYNNGFQFRYCPKGSLDYVGMYVTDINDFSEWEYTTAYGFTVSLAQNEYTSLLVMDLDNAFIAVNITGGSKYNSQSDLERYADMFDFSKLK